jgi:hypothetical protein
MKAPFENCLCASLRAATVTYLFEGTIRYEDSDGATGVAPAGGEGRLRVPEPVDDYSVHTSPATLRAGEQRLKEIQRRLGSEGRL